MHHRLKTVDESVFATALRLTRWALNPAVSRGHNAAFPEFRTEPKKICGGLNLDGAGSDV